MQCGKLPVVSVTAAALLVFEVSETSFNSVIRSRALTSCVVQPTRESEVMAAESSDSATPAPSPGSSGSGVLELSPPPGRPKRSTVWRYFLYDKDKNKSFCQVQVPRDHGDRGGPSLEVCGVALTGKYPTNMKQHLRTAHDTKYQEMLALEKEEEQKKKTQASSKVIKLSTAKQLTVAESFKGKPVYPTTSERYLTITKQLAIFIGSTNVPNSIVENEAFKSFVKSLDSRYPVPGRAVIGKELDKVLVTLKQNIHVLMSQARKIALCADIWSKKGLTSSYLGVTAHFFSRKDHRKHVTLCVKRMPSPHMALHVREKVEEVLHDWELSADKISLIITDSGSNMVAAFRNLVEKRADTEEEEKEQCEEELEEEGQCEEEEEEPCEEDEEVLDEEVEDFVTKEIDHDVTFSTFYNRLSCFSHSLQLVVRRFDEVSSYRSVLQKVRALVRRVNMSTKATERLITLCRKKLVKDCPTRWSSTFLVIERLLQVRSSLSIVLNELEWDNLATSDWKHLENIYTLLKPFAQYTSLVSGEEYTTLSSIIPVVTELSLHLEEVLYYGTFLILYLLKIVHYNIIILPCR